jgi:tetratricopeptide (TPR) repeat protein
MMMKRILAVSAAALLAGCTLLSHRKSDNAYSPAPFYMQWAKSDSAVDTQMRQTVESLRLNPKSATAHNQLGQLLMQKGFSKDAAREFERAIDSDSHFYPAWYNLGIVRASLDDYAGARHAFHRTISLQKGHAEALFQLGLMAEKSGSMDEAVEYYAKAFRHNRQLLDIRVNPRLLDSKLVELALMRNYAADHARQSGIFQRTPAGYTDPLPSQPRAEQAPSPQAPAQKIIPPVAPITDPAKQPPPKTTT